MKRGFGWLLVPTVLISGCLSGRVEESLARGIQSAPASGTARFAILSVAAAIRLCSGQEGTHHGRNFHDTGHPDFGSVVGLSPTSGVTLDPGTGRGIYAHLLTGPADFGTFNSGLSTAGITTSTKVLPVHPIHIDSLA